MTRAFLCGDSLDKALPNQGPTSHKDSFLLLL